jgi:hypothetical protein
VVQKGACGDCGLGFCMPCLIEFWYSLRPDLTCAGASQNQFYKNIPF